MDTIKTWMGIVAVGMMLGGMIAYAQDEEPREVAVETTEDTSVSLFDLWRTGGWAMYPIGLLSIGAVALTIFGFVNYREQKMIRMDLYQPLLQSVRSLDFREASVLCSRSPSVMTNIFSAGLQRLNADTLDLDSVESAMEEAATEENTLGLKPINYISIIASISPMMGLLGTVSGMIKAFQKIGLGGMGDPEKLAGDIGEAMVTTAFGLIVGIPAMFFYFFLKSKFTGNMSRIGRVLGNLTHEMKTSLETAHEDGTLSEFTPPMELTEDAPVEPPQPEAEPREG